MPLGEKAILIIRDAKHSRHVYSVVPCQQRRGQDNQIGLHLHSHPGQGVAPAHDQFSAMLKDTGYATSQILDAKLFLGSSDKLFIVLARGTDVHVEHISFAVGVLLFEQQGLLGRVHAAETGTISHSFGLVPRTNALDEYRGLGLLAIRGAQDLALGGPRRIDQPLELEPRDDILEPTPAILAVGRVIKGRKARCHDDGAKLFLDHDVLLRIVDGAHVAVLFAETTLALLEVEAIIAVDDRHTGYSLGEWDIDRLSAAEMLIKVGGYLSRALLPAATTSGAFVGIHRPRPNPDPGNIVAHIPGDLLHLGMSVQLDVLVLSDRDHLGRENTCRAVQGWEGTVELGHPSAD